MTEATKNKISLSKIGSIPWNKGITGYSTSKKGYKTPDEVSRKIGLSLMGNIPWNVGTIGIMKSNKTSFKKGLHYAPKTEFKKGEVNQKGENNSGWKGGISKQPGYKTVLNRIRESRKKNAGGRFTIKDWIKLKIGNAYLCAMCNDREPNIKLTIDHIIPISKGGSNDIKNIQPLCVVCNSRKHNNIIAYNEI